MFAAATGGFHRVPPVCHRQAPPHPHSANSSRFHFKKHAANGSICGLCSPSSSRHPPNPLPSSFCACCRLAAPQCLRRDGGAGWSYPKRALRGLCVDSFCHLEVQALRRFCAGTMGRASEQETQCLSQRIRVAERGSRMCGQRLLRHTQASCLPDFDARCTGPSFGATPWEHLSVSPLQQQL